MIVEWFLIMKNRGTDILLLGLLRMKTLKIDDVSCR